VFSGVEVIAVDPAEPYAANGLHVCSRRSASVTIYPASFPRTLRRLEQRGIALAIVDVSELQKAEGAVTCCSLVFSGVRAAMPATASRVPQGAGGAEPGGTRVSRSRTALRNAIRSGGPSVAAARTRSMSRDSYA